MCPMNCNCKCNCAVLALIASVIIGVLTAFFQITGLITVTTAFLWVALGIAVVYLGVLVLSTALARRCDTGICKCPTLSLLLAGILGAILLAVILLAFGIVATSVVSAILVGLLLFFLSLLLTGTACLVKVLAGCES